MTELFFKSCLDEEFDLDACNVRCKTVFGEICAGALYVKSPSLVNRGEELPVSAFSPDRFRNGYFRAGVQILALTKTLPLPVDPLGGKLLV